ncbi:GTP-binding protein Rab-3D [Tulasnella sp. JGI-2019a]|nr:GTP-binding protein Rab-3D [Tulasnella sp. JGI-2019a]KAG8998233.1 GTP-binding protein Rab-3D [Tulasnella sp. JGI-2019a]
MSDVDASSRVNDLRVQTELLTFDGSDTSDVTTFLQNVKRVAFSQGRQRDNDWLVDYAEASLTGDALRWFHELDEDTVDSWKALRGAFLHRFKKPVSVPAPAAAPLSPAILSPITQPLMRALPPTSTSTSKLKNIKILIVGDPGVGKSSLLVRYLGNVWMPSILPTVGIHYETFRERRGEDKVILHLWDGSGAEQYKALRTIYYAGTDRIWIVYDVTNRNSFDNVRSWVQDARSSGSNALVFLLANKCDLSDDRVVTEREGRVLAIGQGLNYAEVSAKSNEGVQQLRGDRLPKFE